MTFYNKLPTTFLPSGGFFDLDNIKSQIAELDIHANSPDLWDNPDNARMILQKKSGLEKTLNEFLALETEYKNLNELYEIAPDDPEIVSAIEKLSNDVHRAKFITLFHEPADNNGSFLFIQAGAGGTEAQDWAQMLSRMYARWAERHNFAVEVIEEHEGDVAGIKNITYRISGERAYGWLKNEIGVHRLVRISPFNANGKRQTSFASVDVWPDIDDTIEIDLNMDDIKMDVYRASGAGGQKVNKTSSAVRLTHIPTGIVTSCQVERSQVQNREVALRMLKSKLLEIKEREHLDQIEDIKGVQKDIAWGSQIRSYVFMPYTLAKDHRTGFEMGNINAVMDGDIDGFINAYLKQQSLEKMNNND